MFELFVKISMFVVKVIVVLFEEFLVVCVGFYGLCVGLKIGLVVWLLRLNFGVFVLLIIIVLVLCM